MTVQSPILFAGQILFQSQPGHGTETFVLPTGKECQIRKVSLQFKRWTQPVLFDTYNGKPVVEYNARPMFAEVAVVLELKSQGYDTAWVDSYRNKFWQAMPSPGTDVFLDNELGMAYNRIKAINGRRGGCWDIMAIKGTELIFAELKLIAKDRIRDNQVKWLESALTAGYKPKQFLIVEWNFC